MKRPLVPLIVCLMVAFVGCGGSIASNESAGAARVTGTVCGQGASPSYAVAVDQTMTSEGNELTSKVITLTSAANACACGVSAATPQVTIEIGTLGAAIPTGTYPVPSTSSDAETTVAAAAWYYDFGCSAPLVRATSGSVTLSEVSALMTTGSFDVSFQSGDRLTGTFSAATCAAGAPGADAAACP